MLPSWQTAAPNGIEVFRLMRAIVSRANGPNDQVIKYLFISSLRKVNPSPSRSGSGRSFPFTGRSAPSKNISSMRT
jgi:hypothetical protein